MNKFRVSIFSIIFILLVNIFPVFGQETSQEFDQADYAIGKVQKIIKQKQNKDLQETLGGNQTTQTVQVKILNGPYKGKVVKTQNQLTSNPAYDINIKQGDRVVIDIEQKDKPGDITVYIADKERMPALLVISGLFFMLVLLVGGIKGLKTLISLSITSLLVFFVLIPAILNNIPVIPVTVFVALISVLITMFTISGINCKSISASIGTIGGVICAGIISIIIIKIAPLTGLTDQESVMLWSSRPDLNFTGILTSAMIIGSLGAIMDVGISIASSIDEVKRANPSITRSELMKSGLNVGTDIIGAMSNTLILAYIGGAFPLILLASDVPILKFINLNSIASEITAALAGSIGIVLCVPLTAVIAAYLICKNVSNSSPENIIKE